MPVVTVSRQYGAGGRQVAPLVAQALGFQLADRELIEKAARRLGLDPETARAWDERVPAIIEELGMALAAGTPLVGGGPAPQFDAPGLTPGLSEDALAEATKRVIVSLADTGRYVIMGRGAQAALHERPDAVHLWLVGDLADRARRVMASQGVDEKEARSMCERVDSERSAYVRRYYGKDIALPHLYDAILNTSRLGIEGAADVAVDIARRRLGLE
jgi:cytidylate kinase